MIRIQVPATTTNLGPGFDCLGMALCLASSLAWATGSVLARHWPTRLPLLQTAALQMLLGGTTNHDDSLQALAALRYEWTRTDVPLQTRVNHLAGTASGGLNGSAVLNRTTVQDDAVADNLTGGTDGDWFLTETGAAADHVIDPQADDLTTHP